MENVSSKRSYGISLARVVCAFGIIFYHYVVHTAEESKQWLGQVSWGPALVFAFFLISGFVIYRSYPKIESIKEFYFKRFKKIMPMFWIVFLAAFIDISLATFDLSWGGSPINLIFSVIGMDGLLSGYMQTYYVVGEWFLGAIIICYLLYPIIVKIFNKTGIWLFVICLALAGVALKIPFFQNRGHQNVMLCIAVFVGGMVLSKYALLDNKIFRPVIIALSVVMAGISLHIPNCVKEVIFACGILQLCYLIGNPVGKCRRAAGILTFLDGLTYPIYLLHHIIMMRYVMSVKPDTPVEHLLVLGGSIISTVILAHALSLVTKNLMKHFES